MAAAYYEPKRSMSNRRLTATILSLFLGLAVLYASAFYAPAYINFNQAIGASTENLKLPEQNDSNTFLTPYVKMFKIRRGFVKPGQALKIDYALSPGTYMTVHVKKCNAPVFLEVIYCMNTSEQSTKIVGPSKSARTFLMKEPGFYYFDEFVMNMDGSPTKKPYKVLWTRKNMAQKKGAAKAAPVTSSAATEPLKLRGSSN
ncbi:MAG: hypothetical protein ACSHXY_15310 [Alphaproteobacteria bacterium]